LNQDEPGWWRQVVHADDLARIDEALAESQAKQLPLSCQFRVSLPQGGIRWFEAQGEFDASSPAGQQLLTGLCRDITADKAAEDELRASEERFRKLFEDTRQPTVLLEAGQLIAVNKACVDLFGYQREEQMIGLTPVDCSPPQQPDGRSSAEKAMEIIGQTMQTGSASVEWQCVRPNGELFFIELLLTTIEQQGRVLLHAVFQDITEARNNRVRLSYLAYNDPLTGLSNWVQGQNILNAAVAQAYSQQTQAAVVALGLDKFKLINDLHGHAVGDAILRQAAQRLRKVLRSGDSLCRLSGDEFMLVMTSVQSDRQVQVVFERLQAQFSEPFNVDEFRLSVSVSAGAAVLDVVAGPQKDDVEDASERLLRHADTALSEAKKRGSGSMCLFEASMNARLVHFVQTRDDLRQAIRQDQFELVYQPQVHAQSAQVRGVEALLRWRHPQHGLLTPDDFIQVAEDTGLIVPIGRWVLRQACEQAQVWRAAGWLDVVVSVNVSGLQFTQGDLDRDVADALRQSGLPASNLELELTESMLLHNSEQVMAQVARWHALGIQLAIDDFGTGYSSLSYLHQFRVEHLKIDRSFVVNMLHSERDLALVRTIMQLAQGLQLSTIAEGVENQAQADVLSQLGCEFMQGYLYAKPLPADELVLWLQLHHPGSLS
jgi:diguanylate cyclase (GGDEF)-like protein/PAS domain S-box-containing protein